MAAGTATTVDVVVYFLCFNLLFKKEDISLFAISMTAPTISLMISYTFGLVTNFTITKYFVFPDSTLRISSQFFRYVSVALIILIANFYLMHFLIGFMKIFPTISRAISAIVVGVISFVVHKAFSFEVGKR
jgi:putative flippase GtrA